MSIFCSTWGVDADDHADTCARWAPAPANTGPWGVLRYDNDGTMWYLADMVACSCLCGPLVYQGSHVLPADTDRRGGSLDVAEIPGFISRDGRDDGPDDDGAWPYLRVTMRAENAPDCQDLVLDRGQYVELRDYLTGLIERTETPQ